MLGTIDAHLALEERASVNRIASGGPFAVLIATLISLRTRDEVTFPAAERLLTLAPDPHTLARTPRDRIEAAIYPAGFYRRKAEQLRQIADRLCRDHAAEVPTTLEALLELPGVGRKTANLVLAVGHGIPAICVDIHVHRICNRLGWIATTGPQATELRLRELLPKRHWIGINETLVRFGQRTCTPQSPWCSRCPVEDHCERVGVERSR